MATDESTHDIELTLSRAVNVTDTGHIRRHVREHTRNAQLDGPAVELVQFNVFVLCTEGVGRHMVDFEDHEMHPGIALWIRPGQVQRWSDAHDAFEAIVMVFDSAVIPDLPLLGATRTAMTDLGSDAAKVRLQLEWMAADLEATGDHATAAAVVGVVLRLFARHDGARGDHQSSPRSRLAESFVRSVEANVEQRSVAWHAAQVGASPRTLARATAETFAKRPKDLIDHGVMLEAQRRLAWSDDDVGVIARDLRFSDSSNFTKFFRGRAGVSPSTFRENVRELDSFEPVRP